ncbi:GGDEF domain-containing protein [Desulfovibrio ferrophilus]|uniref:diguanylate cyclase n=1 Tax=Desulfovibrio ferrophilus TaxID=241368 RepID=A0A2Z6B0J7_9BACT|nr:diguanylate cyclase [Desulfovibrio ferrophilus]BBD09004.1 diguanylate cyclase with GAF sensor [Desulfovibrio ferrophilus]
MSDAKQIYAVLKRNEEICRKFFEIETEVLTILDFEALFARLVSLIKTKFDIPHVWISIIRDGELAAMLDNLDASGELREQLALVDGDAALSLLQDRKSPILENRSLHLFDALLPTPAPQGLRSIAVAPLILDGKLVGCLNQADTRSDRFSPDMDTTLLSQLAIKVSLCLSNVTAHERLARLASRDSLTGLLNRRAMEERLHEEFLRSQRYGDSLALAFVDMDDFKKVNDTLGHDAGDAMLVYFSRRLQKMARKIDACARFAGDEFVVILPNTDRKQACAFMERVMRFFEMSPVPDIDRYVRFSFGVSSTEDEAVTSPALLLKKADEELFERKAAKDAPKRRVVGT